MTEKIRRATKLPTDQGRRTKRARGFGVEPELLTYSSRRFDRTSNRGPKPIASQFEEFKSPIFEPNSLDDAFERGFEVVSVPNIVLVKRVRKCLSDREYGFLFSLSGSLTRQQTLITENFHHTSSSSPLHQRVRVVGPNPLRPL